MSYIKVFKILSSLENRAKIIVSIKILAFHVKILKKILVKFNFYKTGKANNPEYINKIIPRYIKYFQKIPIKRKKVVCEIGPGNSLFASLIFLKLGACRYFAVDSEINATSDPKFYIDSINPINSIIKKFLPYKFKNQNKSENFGYNKMTLTELFKKNNIKYLCNGVESFKNISSNSVDFVWSHSVMQHIYLSELETLISEIFRIIKPGGLTVHHIDLKDCINRSVNNFLFPEKIWESELFHKAGFYTNRVRSKEFNDIFIKSGL